MFEPNEITQDLEYLKAKLARLSEYLDNGDALDRMLGTETDNSLTGKKARARRHALLETRMDLESYIEDLDILLAFDRVTPGA